MQKPADNQYPIHELLKQRWSPLAFADRAVEPEKLQSILEAARWAPSCFNEQPWRFILCRKVDADAHQRLVGCLSEGNVAWASKAPVLMLSVAKRTFTHNGKPNRHAPYDVGAAVACAIVEATQLGLVVHQMAGFDAEKARTVFAIPADYEPMAVIALGYIGNPDALSPSLRERHLGPRSRKPLNALVFEGSWDTASSLVKQ